ncbi:hypothetical protein EDD18DRAFT_1464587 [Armillaria luteobubalina]|uniref:Agglutinin C-terminal domain-containing protein n=1 Tax=Armillaria luteobubalina TaxID=153913 RepID=A0AA39Q3H1_9AGAR|nr:hypothetical protein EDD18DRAFT_1464587 [Armillaria luteobubalina]
MHINGDPSNGTPINGWKSSTGFNDTQPHQCWFFQRKSVSRTEIETIIGKNTYLANDYKLYQPVDEEHLILPKYLWEEIWTSSGLSTKKSRRGIFDADDFALVMKGAIAQWGTEKCGADGFAIFCGFMLGRSQANPKEGYTYNFTISDDHSSVVFFNPQNKKFLDNISYDVYLAYI